MDSTTKAEYVAASDATKEGFWFKKFTMKLGIMISDAIPLYCDNNGAIALAKESRSHQKSKHIKRYFLSYATTSYRDAKSRLYG